MKSDSNSLYSVKEVFEKTGLDRRALFEFEKVVPPADRGPEGQNSKGYKYYDEEGVRKLQIISIFRKLNVPTSKIKKIMSDPDFATEDVLAEQIVLLKEKRKEIDTCIQRAESLLDIGTSAEIVDKLASKDLAFLWEEKSFSDFGIDEKKLEQIMENMNSDLKEQEERDLTMIRDMMESSVEAGDYESISTYCRMMIDVYQREKKGLWAVIFFSVISAAVRGSGKLAQEYFGDLSDKGREIVQQSLYKLLTDVETEILYYSEPFMLRLGNLYSKKPDKKTVEKIFKAYNKEISRYYSVRDEICIIFLRRVMILFCHLYAEASNGKEKKIYQFAEKMFMDYYDPSCIDFFG